MTEEWKPIQGYEGLYEVSNYGNVRTADGYTMRGNINSYGYRVVSLTSGGKKKDKKVHRLVAAAFIPTIPGKNDVNHKDGNKLNNYAENLEWVTRRESNAHAATILQADREPRPVWQFDTGGKPLAIFVSASAAARVINGEHMMIAACCKGTAETAYGYKWKYADGVNLKNLIATERLSTIRQQIVELETEARELEEKISET